MIKPNPTGGKEEEWVFIQSSVTWITNHFLEVQEAGNGIKEVPRLKWTPSSQESSSACTMEVLN